MTEAELRQLLRDNPDICIDEMVWDRANNRTTVNVATSPGKTHTVPAIADAMSEHEAQVAVFAWIDANVERWPALRSVFAIPNGGYRHPAVAGKLKAEGVRSGVPDLFIAVPERHLDTHYAGCFVELKVGRNKPSTAQVEWMDRLRHNGYMACVCVGADEAIATIKHYLYIEAGRE